ncbi:WYL domain-containing protein [Myxococcota bacterium]|nr:WYL domain-containing protein [Myxococcota bacterium]
MARNEQMLRQWQILVRLQQGRASRKEFANEFGCSFRTIARDIDALTPNFPIFEEQEGNDIFYAFEQNYRLPGVWFTPKELSVLYLAQKLIAHAAKTSSFSEVFSGLLAKISRTHSTAALRASQRLPQVYQSDFSSPDPRSDYTEEIIRAAQEERCIAMMYFSASKGEEAQRVVEPFVVRLTIQGLHLIAFCRLRQEFRTFTINRIRALSVLEERFSPEARRFDLQRYVEESFGGLRSEPVQKVRFHIRYPTAHWAKDLFYHSTQVIQEVEDGILLTFQAGGEDAIVRRAISLGADCEVLEPPLLRQQVVAKAMQILERYK